jgi:Skp family chaperone for outer membrane proteins
VASSIKKLATDLQKIVSELKIKKAEVVPVLPETFSVEEPETGALAEAVVKVLRQMAENVSTIAKVAETSEEVSETVQTEIGTADALLTAMAEKLPTQTAKSAKLFSTTLSEVAERALTLSRKANESGFRETRALREISNIQKLLEGVAQKYAGVKKAGEFDIGDLSAVLGADRLLNEFEAQLVKHGMISEPPKVEPPVLAAPVIQPAAPPVAPPVEQVAAVVSPAPDQNPEILAKMETMAKQLAELRTIVAKARGTVAAPASAGNDLITEHNDEALLFPENYNSPAYREALAKRAEAEVQS